MLRPEVGAYWTNRWANKASGELQVCFIWIFSLKEDTDTGVHSVRWVEWKGRGRTECEPCPGENSWRVSHITQEAVCATFIGKQRCFLTHQPWCFYIPLGFDRGIFQKQVLDTSCLLIQAIHIPLFPIVCVSVFVDGCPAPDPLVIKNWNPAWQVWGLGEGLGWDLSQQKSLQKSRTARERWREGAVAGPAGKTFKTLGHLSIPGVSPCLGAQQIHRIINRPADWLTFKVFLIDRSCSQTSS